MKKNYLLAGMVALMLASCSTEEQPTGGYVAGSKITLNASLPNSGTRVNEAADDTYGLKTTWSDDDSLDMVAAGTIVSMTKGDKINTFYYTPANAEEAACFNAGETIYGVNNKSNDHITTDVCDGQLYATVDFRGQNGTVDNLAKYDLMYGTGDPTDNIMFNHKICVMRLDINSDQLRTDNIKSITDMTLTYALSSGTGLFASQEEYNFGTYCDSTITDAASIVLSNATGIDVSSGAATVYIAVPNRLNLFGTLAISINAVDANDNKNKYNLSENLNLNNSRMLMSTVHPLAIKDLTHTPPVNIGDFLFSDGTWGTLAANTNKTPVALIFSNETSTADKENGWSNGYAMALNNVNTEDPEGVSWSYENNNFTDTTITTIAEIMADKDGYTHTMSFHESQSSGAAEEPVIPYFEPETTISEYVLTGQEEPTDNDEASLCNSTRSINDQFMNPAGYAAATTYEYEVNAPVFTSGWYLPSIGQWYDICVNLGKMNKTHNNTDEIGYYWSAENCVLNLNACLSQLNSDTYVEFSTPDRYWSSSEKDEENAYMVGFVGDKVGLGAIDKTANSHVRPVIAF